MYLAPLQCISKTGIVQPPYRVYKYIHKYADDIAFYAKDIASFLGLYKSIEYLFAMLDLRINTINTKIIKWNLGTLPANFEAMLVDEFVYLGVRLVCSPTAPIDAYAAKLAIIDRLAALLVARTRLALRDRVNVFNLFLMSKITHIVYVHGLPDQADWTCDNTHRR